MERLSLAITGMSCGHCVRAVDQALRQVPGVEVNAVQLGSATVSYDPAVTSPEQITKAVTESGYEARAA
jgi:copper chaperone